MTAADFLFPHIILIAGNLLMAAYHASLIKKQKPIKHGIWAGAYLIVVAVICWFFTWWYLPVGLFLRAVLFGPALSLFRGLPINYISTSTTSIIDKLEYRLFKRNWYAREVVYIVLLAVSEVLLFTL